MAANAAHIDSLQVEAIEQRQRAERAEAALADDTISRVDHVNAINMLNRMLTSLRRQLAEACAEVKRLKTTVSAVADDIAGGPERSSTLANRIRLALDPDWTRAARPVVDAETSTGAAEGDATSTLPSDAPGASQPVSRVYCDEAP